MIKSEHISELKQVRLSFKWSQDQLAELSGLSIRTIQRIENGEKASLESIKALSVTFEIDFYTTNTPDITEQENEYIEKLKGFYKLISIAVLCLILPFIIAINQSEWTFFIYILLTWLIIIGLKSNEVFDFFGEKWKKKQLTKKFQDKS